MITDEVIKEIYDKFGRPPRDRSELRLEHYIEMLRPHHSLKLENDEIIVESMDEFNPFRRFLIRGLSAVLEFDKMVAFVLRDHIIFFEKNGGGMHVHFKPINVKRPFWKRLFSRR